MTLLGIIREIDAANRRGIRDEQRSLREMKQYHAQARKHAQLVEAARLVDEHEAYVRQLSSIHHDCQPTRDWPALTQLAEPREPAPCQASQHAAKARFLQYRPSLFDRLFFRAEGKQAELEGAVRRAIAQDARETESRLELWRTQVADTKLVRTLAMRVVAREQVAYRQVIEELMPLGVLKFMASEMRIRVLSLTQVVAELQLKDEDVIPDTLLSLTKTGKLSEKAMPKKQYWELYQDVVCATALRAARELLSLLPFTEVLIHTCSEAPSTVTGLVERGTVLSVRFQRGQIERLNMEGLDPSDSLRNFEHHMDFKRGQGFRFVAPLPEMEVAARR